MTDGSKIILRRFGRPTGKRLIISHGNGFAIDGYFPFWKLFIDQFDVVLFDMRNHGQNQRSSHDHHNYFQMARDLGTIFADIEKHWGDKTTVGIFHSMSARAAMKHALEIGWVWDALVLFDPPNVPPKSHPLHEKMSAFEKRLIDFAMNRREKFNTREQLAEEYSQNRGHSRWVQGAHELMSCSVLKVKKPNTYWELICQRELEASIYLAAMTINLRPRYDEYKGPVKLICADPEMKGAPPTAQANLALHKENGYPYQAVEGTGHMLQIEKPLECAAAVIQFLEECKIIR